MSDLALLLLLVVAGFLVGVGYLCALWWTLALGVRKRWPAWKMVASFLARGGIAGAAFYLLMAGDVRRLVAVAAGFVLARVVMVRRLGKSRPVPTDMNP